MDFEKRIIGDCTLYRGDSLALLKTGVFGKLGAIVSDPPYGIGYQHSGGGNPIGMSRSKGGTIGKSKTCTIIGDDVPFDPQPWLEAAPVAPVRAGEWGKTGGQPLLIMWGADNFMQRLPTGGTLLAWDKHLGRAGDDSFADCEWAWCGRKVKREVFRWLWKGVVAQKTVLDMTPKEAGKKANHFTRVHISQKPVELMRWCIEKVRPLVGLPIFDPYMGSGSTAIAALSQGHSFIGCEIDAEHFETACRRIEAYYLRHGDAAED